MIGRLRMRIEAVIDQFTVAKKLRLIPKQFLKERPFLDHPAS